MHSMQPTEKDLEYIYVLKAIEEIPFGIGKKLLIDFLRGKKENESIAKNRLHLKKSFGTLAYTADELESIIDDLIRSDMIQQAPLKTNIYWKVLALTEKGKKEIYQPTLYKRKLKINFSHKETIITEYEKKFFASLGDLLSKFSDSQKKAITSSKNQILCIAGAGSGKTTVLTKRIEFLVKYRSVEPKKILAITFTRKAMLEMRKRLSLPGTAHVEYVTVETFNSFSEKILLKHDNIAYDKETRVISYRDKIIIINKALSSQNTDMQGAITRYFSSSRENGKTQEQLANIFISDCFFVRDYFKFKNKPLEKSSFIAESSYTENIKARDMLISTCIYIEAYMKKYGLRDFADQLIDTIALFEKHKDLIPRYDHILIDEYQDINSTQIKLIDILNPENIFCVGDPRQSIYGWRGSDIRYILNFEEKYPDCEIITLTENYRSTSRIVSLINKSIQKMGLPDLKSSSSPPASSPPSSLASSALKKDTIIKDISISKYDTEDEEYEYLIQKITASELPRSEIFVLARTNRQLNDISNMMKSRGIKHIVRSDEMRKTVEASPDDITLATIHAIKGLEAELVFVVGCSMANFPCRGSEHPVIEMLKVDEYDKEEEERRLLYVAMSRAKSALCLSYSGSRPTYFITSEMLKLLDGNEPDIRDEKPAKNKAANQKNIAPPPGDQLLAQLKEWRRALSKDTGTPAFMILHDRTLQELAALTPKTTDELCEIHGLGPSKISRYGNELIEIINKSDKK